MRAENGTADNKENSKKLIYVLAFIAPIFLYIILCIRKNIYPFGTLTNLWEDLQIQYTDYYIYYRNVLLGNANIGYSFSKSLGGSFTALWGYYLASPFNLLLLFFPPEKMQAFVFVTTALKLGICGVTFSLFIKNKFHGMEDYFVLVLSIAYSFTQYTVGQISNLNWLDGVYMLPLILYAADKFIYNKKKIPLYIMIALSVCFNWYTGYMNCLFLAIYFIAEEFLYEKNAFGKVKIEYCIRKMIAFGSTVILSVGTSLIVFLPVLLGQSKGRSVFDQGIFAFATNGNFLNILRGFMIGSPNPSREITLFCSVFVLIGILYFFADKKINKWERKTRGLVVVIMICSLYFQPLEHIWCGMKYEGSYAYRYLYVAIISVLLLCASVLEHARELDWKKLTKIIIGLGTVFLIFHSVETFETVKLLTMLGVLTIYALFCIAMQCHILHPSIMKVGLCIVFLVEISVNAGWVFHYLTLDYRDYENYVAEEKELVDKVLPSEKEFYRIEKTLNRDNNLQHNSFYANESMAYGYSGIQHYSSSYDAITSQTLAFLGYCRGEFPTFYHDPILPADSLLGIKYLLSETEYTGYIEEPEHGPYNGKSAYLNPYALSTGFAVSNRILEVQRQNNSFQYVNDIYSGILGEEIQIYRPMQDYQEISDENGVLITWSSTSEDEVLYACIAGSNLDLSISINGAESKPYQTGWSNQYTLVIGDMGESGSLHIANIRQEELNIVFYTVNLSYMQEITDRINAHAIHFTTIEDGHIEFDTAEQSVMLSIPYDESWGIEVDGNSVSPEIGAEAFVVIDTGDSQEHHVSMNYKVKGQREGLVAGVFCVVVMFSWSVCGYSKTKERKS